MTRNLEVEIDALKDEIKDLTNTINRFMPPNAPEARENKENEEEMKVKCPRAYQLREEYPSNKCLVSFYGFFDNADSHYHQSYYWDMNRSGDILLNMNDDKVAKVLSALASRQRLAILKSILRSPGSAADLVERLNLGTTGQVYHHLKALQSADLITQEERGLFIFKGHRVPGLIMLLVGVSEMLDEEYSSGRWEE